MPVPRLHRTITPNPLPGVRVTAAETPESEGAGLARAQARTSEAGAQLAGGLAQIATGEAAKIAEHAQQQADHVTLLQYNNTLAAWEHKRLYTDPNAALSLQGEAAFPLPEQVASEFNAQADAAGAKLPARLRDQAATIRAQRSENLDLTIRRHVSGEIQKHTADELQAGLENHSEAAIANANDPMRVKQEIDGALGDLRKIGPTLGFGKEQLTKQTNDFLTSTHAGVIMGLIQSDQPGKARAYFDAVKDQIVGTTKGDLEQQVEDAGIRKQGQQAADTIVAEGGTLAEQLAKVKLLEDPTGKLRDEVEQRLEHAQALSEKADRDKQEQAAVGLFNAIDQAKPGALPSVDALQKQTGWFTATPDARAAAISYLERKARGFAIKSDWSLYYSMLDMAGRNQDKFMDANLLPLKAKLDDPEWKHLTQIQLAMRQGDTRGAAHQLEGFRTSEQIISDSLAQYGIDASDKAQKASVASLRRLVDLQVETLQTSSGKKVTNVDVQDIVDKILSAKVDAPGSWWGTLKIPTLGFDPFGIGNFYDTTTPVVTLTVGDVPAADRKLIETALRETGRPVSDATVLDYYQKLKLLTSKK